MKHFVHPNIENVTLPGLLAALADPARLKIVEALHRAKDGLCCSEASSCVDLPKSTLSNHFRVLRESGLIHTEKQGLEHLNRLRKAEIDKKFPGLLTLVLTFSKEE